MSTDTHTKDQIVYSTCLTLIKHIKNHIIEQRDGIHTRIFSHILHPEEKFVYIGRSAEATSETQNHPEHVVPCKTLITETRRLLEEGRLSEDEIAKLLQRHWKIATITKVQANRIDRKYKSTMPVGWCFEKGDTLARLNEAGIAVA